MNDLDRIRAVETGLLPEHVIQGRPWPRYDLRERMAHYNVPGVSIAVIDQGEIAWAKGYGVREARGDEPVTTETLFQAASVSKPVTALGALLLVEAGVLDMDDDINTVLRSWQIPEHKYAGRHPVTLRRLITHTAGLNLRGYRGYVAGRDVPTVRQVLAGTPPANSRPVRVTQRPGKAFKYSGGGYVVIQQLLEDVTGKSFANLMQELLFDRLGMANSMFGQPLPEAYASRAATGHRRSGKPVTGRWHIYPELAAAGLWTTPSDLARFALGIIRAHAGHPDAVLPTDVVRDMLASHVVVYDFGWFGLGLEIMPFDGTLQFTHPGWNEGFRCFMIGYTGLGSGAVVMHNGEDSEQLWREIVRGISEVYGWPGFRPAVQAAGSLDPGADT